MTDPSRSDYARPLVSVCIPTYKGCAFLDAAIESVLAQTLADWELVIVDDASPDDTTALVSAYADPRIRYLRNARNLGPEGNWNRALAEARGRYFKLLPQDDLLMPDCLARQVAVLEADGEQSLALVTGPRRILDPAGRELMVRGRARAGRVGAERLVRCSIRAGTNLIGEPGAVLMRHSLAERIGHFSAAIPYLIDLDYWVRALAHGDAWRLAEPVAAFRVSAGSWSVALSARQAGEFRCFARKVATEEGFRISALDCVLGGLRAGVKQLARAIVYRLVLARRLR